jgi:hypothetical protein
MARPRTREAAGQLQLVADLIELIEVRVPLRQRERIGYVVHCHSFPLARSCRIPKVFFSERFDEMSALAANAGLRLSILLTIAH